MISFFVKNIFSKHHLSILFLYITFTSTVGWTNQCLEITQDLSFEQAIRERFELESSRFLKIRNGDILEGSKAFGGMQPNYVVNYDSKLFLPLKLEVERIKGNPDIRGIWRKMSALTSFIQKEILPRREYDDPIYLKLLGRYANKDRISLSEYVKHRAGTCRENAMILHLALQLLGVPSRYLYVRVNEPSETEGPPNIESHAVVVVFYKKEIWVVDSYNFNTYTGYRLDQLLEKEGVQSTKSRIEDIDGGEAFGQKFEEIHSHPNFLN